MASAVPGASAGVEAGGRPKRDPIISLIEPLTRFGRPGRELAVRLDLTRSTGLGYAWRRIINDARRAPVDGSVDPTYWNIWADAANAVGAEIVPLPAGFVELRTEAASTRVWRQWVMLDDAVTLRFALEKALVHLQLESQDLPIPEHLEFRLGTLGPAAAFLERSPNPCVVKPAASSGGSGVTTQVRSHADLKRACVRASRTDDRLMIERQAAGDAYRLLYLDGTLLDVVKRHPPAVTGDGRSTIERLILEQNRRRVARQPQLVHWPLRIDLDCVLTLQAAGLRLDTVLPEGVSVPVKTVVSEGDNETVQEPIGPGLDAEARTAVEMLGLRLAGVDIITSDVSKSLAVTGGVILEVNGTPGLHYHYEVVEPACATRVAIPILRTLLQSRMRAYDASEPDVLTRDA